MAEGISTPNLPTSTAVVEVIGNRDQSGVRETVRITLDALSSLLAANGAIADAIASGFSGISRLEQVVAASTASLTLASGAENGDTIDGVVLATGDRILLKDQAAPAENGIYVVAASGAPTRATDADSSDELVGAAVYVAAGTANAGTLWRMSTAGPVTVGSTALAWAKIEDAGAALSAVADVEAEVIAARGAEASLDDRITLVDEQAAATAGLVYEDDDGFDYRDTVDEQGNVVRRETADAVTDARTYTIAGRTFYEVTDPWLDELGIVAAVEDDEGIIDARYADGTRDIAGFVTASSSAGAAGDFDDGYIAGENARALSLSASRRSVRTFNLLNWSSALALMLHSGQSLADGSEGWARLTKDQRLGALMLGNLERGQNNYASTFTPYGAATLNPFVAGVNKPYGGFSANLYDDAAVSGFSHVTTNDVVARGESGLSAAMHQFKRMWMQAEGLDTLTSRNLVGVNIAVGGRSIEDLTTYQAIAGDVWSKVSTAAGATPLQPIAILHDQGQENYTTNTWDQSRGGFAEKTKDYFDSLADSIDGGLDPASIPRIMRATGGLHVRDLENNGGGPDYLNMSISMAQLDLAAAEDNVFVSQAGMGLGASRNGGHPTVNLYRQIGCKDGQVLWTVLHDKRRWEPLQPLDGVAYLRGKTILLPMSVPHPPLQSAPTYQTMTPVTFDDLGFSPIVLSSQERLGIASITIKDAVVVIVLEDTPPEGDLELRYRGQDLFEGMGNLVDSDPTVAVENHEMPENPKSGELDPALEGLPYDMRNGAVPFQIPIERLDA